MSWRHQGIFLSGNNLSNFKMAIGYKVKMSRDVNPFLWIVSFAPLSLPHPSLSSLFPTCLPCLSAFTHISDTYSMLDTALHTEENKAISCFHGACILVGETQNKQVKEREEGRKSRGYLVLWGKYLSEGECVVRGRWPRWPGRQMLHNHLLPLSCPAPVCCSWHCSPSSVGFLPSLN